MLIIAGAEKKCFRFVRNILIGNESSNHLIACYRVLQTELLTSGIPLSPATVSVAYFTKFEGLRENKILWDSLL